MLIRPMLAVLLAACDGESPTGEPVDLSGTAAEEDEGDAEPPTGEDGAADQQPTGEDALTSGCRDVTPEGNVYVAADGGEAEIRFSGAALELVEVRPAEGWEHRMDDEERREIEIDFIGPDRTLQLEVEIDDGRIEADVCVDS